jgi:geranylgeranyl diphosphate synthase type II
MRTGAIIADASDEQLKVITEFAEKFGLAFQICDDILDEISSFEEMGKTIGKDKEEGKLTYTSLYGLEQAKCKLVCLTDECYDIINKHNIKSDIIKGIIEQIRKRAGI